MAIVTPLIHCLAARTERQRFAGWGYSRPHSWRETVTHLGTDGAAPVPPGFVAAPAGMAAGYATRRPRSPGIRSL